MPTSVIYEGDEAAAKAHLPRAQNLLHKVREFVAASGAGVYSSTLVLDDRSYTYALKNGDIEIIHIFSQPLTESPASAPNFIETPDFLNGVVRGGFMRTDTDNQGHRINVLESFKPNSITAKRIGHVGADYLDSTRLTVSNGDVLASLNGVPTPPPLRAVSQYATARPSCYSGRMQQLVQVVLGYGRLTSAQLIEKNPERRETIRRNGVQLAYDFRFARTHGLATGADGEQWLVEISVYNGVLAMPLPRYPDTVKLADTAPPDVAVVVREFSGLPTGEGFPVGAKLDAAIKAGTVLRLLPPEALADVYGSKAAYYSSCGWAFNRAGTEAHITCWNYGDDKMKRGFHYALRIAIGAVDKQRKAGEPLAEASANLLLISTGRIYYPSTLLDPPDVYPQPPFRIYEPLQDKLLTFMLAPGFSGDEDEPDYSQVKFICDTTVHAYFSEDDNLKLVKYYYDHRMLDTTIVTGSIPDGVAEFVGEHTRVTETGARTVPPVFYTTDYDIRREVVTQRVTNTVGGSVLSIGQPTGVLGGLFTIDTWLPPLGMPLDTVQPPFTGTDAEIAQRLFDAGWRFGVRGGMWRFIYLQTHSTLTNEVDPYTRSGIVIPDGIREGIAVVLYEHGAYRDVITGAGMVIPALDHYSYGLRTYNNALGPNPPRVTQVDTDGIYDAGDDTQGVLDFGEWASLGQFIALPAGSPDPSFVTSGSETTSLTHKFTLTLFTGHMPGGVVLQKIEESIGEIITYENDQQVSFEDTSSGPTGAAAAEWALWIDPNTKYPDGAPLNMGVYYSANLGERQTVYDTKLVAMPADRRGIGSLVNGVDSYSTREKFNFIGVP